jgi:hypothetical protein
MAGGAAEEVAASLVRDPRFRTVRRLSWAYLGMIEQRLKSRAGEHQECRRQHGGQQRDHYPGSHVAALRVVIFPRDFRL